LSTKVHKAAAGRLWNNDLGLLTTIRNGAEERLNSQLDEGILVLLARLSLDLIELHNWLKLCLALFLSSRAALIAVLSTLIAFGGLRWCTKSSRRHAEAEGPGTRASECSTSAAKRREGVGGLLRAHDRPGS
jgi:hypothetical protein